jgi:hypothetical protein
VPRRRWAEVFPITLATLLRRHRRQVWQATTLGAAFGKASKATRIRAL